MRIPTGGREQALNGTARAVLAVMSQLTRAALAHG